MKSTYAVSSSVSSSSQTPAWRVKCKPMGKKFVKITLATKLRLLFGAALLGIIAAALLVPWWFTEMLAEQTGQNQGIEPSRYAYNDFVRQHAKNNVKALDALSSMKELHTGGVASDDRAGPLFIPLKGPDTKPKQPRPRSEAIKLFRDPKNDQDMLVIQDESGGKPVFRCFQAVRAEPSCIVCHGKRSESITDDKLLFHLGDLVGVIDTTLPAKTTSLVWWTRGAFIAGGVLAAALAFVLFNVLTQRLILRPVRRLQNLADKVTEGDLSVRSTVRTGDELQRLGDSFNEMLVAITDQHEQLRSANRALDMKLSELTDANVTLFKANQVKNEFLANVSHELRTPLNSIIGFADLIGGSEDERLRRYGQNIVSSAKNLLSMINDILDLAKIEAGKAEVRFDMVSITDTCQTLAGLMKPL
ncbi:MAG: HAMP domain-containing protein, partial [Planctomycetaceae bacterium]